jgi:hypothetical protein
MDPDSFFMKKLDLDGRLDNSKEANFLSFWR